MYTPRKMHALSTAGYLAASIFVPIILVSSSGKTGVGTGTIVVGSGILLAIAGYHWFRYKRTPPDAEFYDITKRPAEEQIVVSRRLLWAMSVLGLALGAMTYYELSELETGGRESVMLWPPVAMLYERMGFWPAVLCCPVIFGAIAALAFFRIGKAKSDLRARDSR